MLSGFQLLQTIFPDCDGYSFVSAWHLLPIEYLQSRLALLAWVWKVATDPGSLQGQCSGCEFKETKVVLPLHQKTMSNHAWEGELDQFYYKNWDVQLLLNLLASSSGLSGPLRSLALIDKDFNMACLPEISVRIIFYRTNVLQY